MGPASNSKRITEASTAGYRYPEAEYAVQVPLNAARPGAAVKSKKGTGTTVKWQDGIDQYIYKEGETSADEPTIWQQNAYNDHLIQ